MSQILNEELNSGGKLTVVDLGCGDFELGRQLVARAQSANYIGCDIVPELVENLSTRYANERVRFKCLDIVADELPDGDVCLIRQVLQHLSNAEIMKVLRKLHKFRRVYITEGYPVEVSGLANPDKLTSHDIRFDLRTGRGRGVELDKEPYCVPARELFRVSNDVCEIIITFEVCCAPPARF
jgi:hypothetical protein